MHDPDDILNYLAESADTTIFKDWKMDEQRKNAIISLMKQEKKGIFQPAKLFKGLKVSFAAGILTVVLVVGIVISANQGIFDSEHTADLLGKSSKSEDTAGIKTQNNVALNENYAKNKTSAGVSKLTAVRNYQAAETVKNQSTIPATNNGFLAGDQNAIVHLDVNSEVQQPETNGIGSTNGANSKNSANGNKMLLLGDYHQDQPTNQARGSGRQDGTGQEQAAGLTPVTGVDSGITATNYYFQVASNSSGFDVEIYAEGQPVPLEQTGALKANGGKEPVASICAVNTNKNADNNKLMTTMQNPVAIPQNNSGLGQEVESDKVEEDIAAKKEERVYGTGESVDPEKMDKAAGEELSSSIKVATRNRNREQQLEAFWQDKGWDYSVLGEKAPDYAKKFKKSLENKTPIIQAAGGSVKIVIDENVTTYITWLANSYQYQYVFQGEDFYQALDAARKFAVWLESNNPE